MGSPCVIPFHPTAHFYNFMCFRTKARLFKLPGGRVQSCFVRRRASAVNGGGAFRAQKDSAPGAVRSSQLLNALQDVT